MLVTVTIWWQDPTGNFQAWATSLPHVSHSTGALRQRHAPCARRFQRQCQVHVELLSHEPMLFPYLGASSTRMLASNHDFRLLDKTPLPICLPPLFLVQVHHHLFGLFGCCRPRLCCLLSAAFDHDQSQESADHGRAQEGENDRDSYCPDTRQEERLQRVIIVHKWL